MNKTHPSPAAEFDLSEGLAFFWRKLKGKDGKEIDPLVQRFVQWGAGPRASQYLVLGAKARAALHGHEVVRMADLAAVAPLVLGHRVLLNFQAEAEGQTAPALVATLAGAALT